MPGGNLYTFKFFLFGWFGYVEYQYIHWVGTTGISIICGEFVVMLFISTLMWKNGL